MLSRISRSFRLVDIRKSFAFPKKNFKYSFSRIIGSRAVHMNHPQQFDVDQCAELNSKLESVPYIDLMNRGLSSFHTILVQEKDVALTDALSWLSKVFDYNVKDGKKIRGTALLKAYCAYSCNTDDSVWKNFDSDGWKAAVTLAWCVEMLQAFFVVCDDIMDQSILRRGKPCWYKQEDVGLCAINDSLLLNCGIYKILHKCFGNQTCYNSILHEFLQVTHKTVNGQCLDMWFNPTHQRPRFENFTYERYQTLVQYKTSYYTFCLPIHLAMHLVGNCSSEDFKSANDLCMKIGLYFQAQDDYLDCFGDPKITGKMGNDIREGKCTWFAVKFLEQATESMQQKFKDNYGFDKEESITEVLNMYKRASLMEKFEQFDEELSADIYGRIGKMNESQGGLFYNLFSQIRKRQK